MDYDFIVIGGGPAGSTFARLVSHRYRVLVVDIRKLDKPYDTKRGKTCGGLLNTDAQKEIAILGKSIPSSVLRGPQMFTVKAIDIDNNLASHYQQQYLNVDREAFDRFLFSLIPSNVDKLTGAMYRGYEPIENGAKVCVSIEGEKKYLTCRRIIAADGASSKLRKSFSPDIKLPRTYACPQAHFRVDKRLDYMFSVFDSDVSDYYSWGIQKEDVLVIGSAIDDIKNANYKFSILLEKLRGLGLDLKGQIKREGAMLFRPKSHKDIYLGRRPVHFIGEAAGLISPSSSEGISFALRSGRLLAESINRSYAGFEYEYAKSCKSMLFRIFYKEKKSRIMYNSFSRRNIIKSGVISVDTGDFDLRF